MSGNINGIMLTGCAGNGKSTFMHLLASLLVYAGMSRKSVLMKDMSAIIAWCKHQDSELGKEIRDQQSLTTRGRLLSEPLPIRAYLRWLSHMLCRRSSKPKLLIVAGAPRNINQAIMLDAFNAGLVIHILADQETSTKSIYKRMEEAGGKKRDDDCGGEAVINTRWREFLEETLPVIRALESRGIVLTLDRQNSLMLRFMQTMDYLNSNPESSPVNRSVVRKAIQILHDPHHPICKKINRIDSGKD